MTNCPVCEKQMSIEILTNDLLIMVNGGSAERVFCPSDCDIPKDVLDEAKHIKKLTERICDLFPDDNKGCDLSEFTKKTIVDSLGVHYNAANKAAGFSKGKYWNFTLVGKTGRGKTRLSLAIIKELSKIRRTFKPYNSISTIEDIGYFKASEIVRICSKEEKKGMDEFYKNCTLNPVLFIDELKPSNEMKYRDSSTIEDIIEIRNQYKKITILTSNLTLKEFKEEYPRIHSRVIVSTFEFIGEDMRAHGN